MASQFLPDYSSTNLGSIGGPKPNYSMPSMPASASMNSFFPDPGMNFMPTSFGGDEGGFMGGVGKGIGSFMGRFGGNAIIDPNNMSFMDKLTGGRTADGKEIGGFGGAALGLGKSIFGGFMDYKNMKQADEQLQFSKDAFNKQFTASKTLINNQLRDQDATRLRREPTYQSTTKFI